MASWERKTLAMRNAGGVKTLVKKKLGLTGKERFLFKNIEMIFSIRFAAAITIIRIAAKKTI